MRVHANAAPLTHYVSLAAPPVPPLSDGEGGIIDTVVPLNPPTDWAAIEPATATNDELPIAGTVQNALTHHVTLRYRADVNLQTEITFTDYARRSRRLWVRALQNPLQQSEYLELWCEERTTA